MGELQPSKLWYVSYLMFGVLTGIACFLIWSDKDKNKATSHLITSIWLPLVAWIPMVVVPLLFLPDEF